MKLQFKIQQYQTDAVESTVDIFNGQPNQGLLEYKMDQGKVYVIDNGKRIEQKAWGSASMTQATRTVISCFLKESY